MPLKRNMCCLLPPKDYNDEIRQEQLRELSYLNGSDETSRGRAVPARALRPAFSAASRCNAQQTQWTEHFV